VNCLVKSFWHSESFLPTGKKFPDNWKKFSRQLEKIFPTTGKNFPDNWKKFSRQLEKIFLLFVRKPFKFSKIENFFPDNWKNFSRQLEKNFPTTGKIFPDNWKSSSFRQDTNECPTFLFLNVFQSQKNRQPQHHNRLTKTKHLIFKLAWFALAEIFLHGFIYLN
ncbi:hypothetical protein TVAG_534580, partial [Trichomonas vaginalis G3]